MRKVRLFGAIVCLCLIFVITKDSFADRRSYVWTYEYQTLPKGMSEIEYYDTMKIPDTNDPGS